MPTYLILFVLALVSSFLLVPVTIWLGRRLRIVDVPSELSIHTAPIPRTGGIAMAAAFAVAVIFAYWGGIAQPRETTLLLGIVLGNLVIMLAGLLDDINHITPLQKFLAEFLGAAIAVGFGIQVGILPVLGIPFGISLFYLVGAANALNLLDGMNGLAAGVAAIAALFLGGLALLAGSPLGLIIALALLGSTLGFLPYNFPRARVFMGDAGSLFLGFTLASGAILLAGKPDDWNGFLAALFVLGLPILDTAAALVRRFSRLGDLFTGDREHLYDLLARRWGGIRAVLATWGWATLFGLAGWGLVVFQPFVGIALAAFVTLASVVLAARLGAFGPEFRAGKTDLGAALARVIERYGAALFVDALLTVASFYTALLIRFSEVVPQGPSEALRYAEALTSQIVFIVIVYALTNSVFGLYNRVWRYASSQEVTSIAGSVTLGTVVLLVAYGLSGAERTVPISVMVLGALLLVGASTAYRYRTRLVTGLLWRLHVIDDGTPRRVMIIGAGESGQLLAWRMQHQSRRYRVVGLVDDDPHKIGLRIHGVKVLGNCQHIPHLVSENKVDLLIFAIHQTTAATQREILDQCLETRAQVKMLPDILDSLAASDGSPVLKDVTVEDLVGREAVAIDEAICRNLISGKTVLVTGAAGSIGAELCRQVVRFAPSRLIAVDNNESGLFELAQEIGRTQDRPRLEVVIGDVTHDWRMAQVFAESPIHIVFHCAAYKHVPLMESFACEAVQVNLGGTLTLLRLAEAHQVERFVYISSDKAVHPTNVMGATKSVGEWLIRALPKDLSLFTAVRFGNVLSSRGSVVPTFAKQIDQGGPVTVTHPEMTRFFMSIPEAVGLIIEAATFTQGGDLFILDAGQKLKIDDLARKMIRVRGLRPDQDIQIEYTGVRPGEKLHEVLSCPGCEECQPTAHPRIFRVIPRDAHPVVNLFSQVENLVALSCEEKSEIWGALETLMRTHAGNLCPHAPAGLATQVPLAPPNDWTLPGSTAFVSERQVTL